MIEILEQGSPITEEDIKNLERSIGVSIPPSYRGFLLKNNGGRPEPNGIIINGLGGEETDIAWFNAVIDSEESNTIKSTIGIIREGYPHKNVLPIARDSGGSIFCIDLEEDADFPVVFVEAGGAWQEKPYEPLFVAPNFEAFLDMIH